MTYKKLYEIAEWKLDHGKITSGEFDEMTKPLDEEIRTWIPCSESLPKESGFYLCTLHYAIPPYHMFHPENDIYVDEVSVQKFDGKFIDSVVAWMPRPKPYKEEGEAE